MSRIIFITIILTITEAVSFSHYEDWLSPTYVITFPKFTSSDSSNFSSVSDLLENLTSENHSTTIPIITSTETFPSLTDTTNNTLRTLEIVLLNDTSLDAYYNVINSLLQNATEMYSEYFCGCSSDYEEPDADKPQIFLNSWNEPATKDNEDDAKVISSGDEPDLSNEATLDCLGIHEYCTGNQTETCYCDDDCVLYMDCCWGALQNNSFSHMKDHATIETLFKCERLVSNLVDGREEWKYVYLIATCPSDWEEYDEVRMQCEVAGTFPYPDAFLRIPVTGKLTHRTYRNVFCAICNRDLDIVYWNTKAFCPSEDNPTSLESAFENSTTNSESPHKENNATESAISDSTSPDDRPSTSTKTCSNPEVFLHKLGGDVVPIVSAPSEISSFLHECNKHPSLVGIIDKCSKDWLKKMENFTEERGRIQKNCETYIALVFSREPYMKIYKNKFCAKCNDDFIPENNVTSNIFCFAPSMSLFTPFILAMDAPNSFRSGHFPQHKKAKPIFSALFDINIGVDRHSVVGYKSQCSPTQTFDITTKQCRELYCGKNSNYDGKCIKNSSRPKLRLSNIRRAPVSKPQNLTGVNVNTTRTIDTCPFLIHLPQHEFSILEKDNETIVIVNATGIRLEDGEYDLDDNGTVLIMCATYQDSYIPLFDDVDGYLSVICTSISIISLSLKILLHFLVEKSVNLPSKMVLQLSAALVIAQLLFLIGTPRTELGTLCQAIGVVIHYTFLASFFWMNSLAFDICRTFYTGGLRHGSNRALAYYCLYAWGGPLLIVTASIILEWSGLTTPVAPEYGVSGCWISNRLALLLLFACPLGVTLLANFVLLTITVFSIASAIKSSKMAHENQKNQHRDRLRVFLYIKLSLIMGITWILAFISPFANSSVLRYLFIVFNSLQGLFILIAFTNFRKIFEALIKRRKSMQDRQSTTDTSMSNSGSQGKYVTTTSTTNFTNS